MLGMTSTPDSVISSSEGAAAAAVIAPVEEPAAVPQRDRRPWGWLVALVVLVLLVGGGVGAYAVSNVVAASRYADRIATGDAVAVLSIPRLGADYAVPIVKGTNWASLRQGLGWYDGTAGPGQYGNFAVAGHRLGWGQPFAGLDSLELGDEIQVTTTAATYTYRVTTPPTIVSGDQTDLLSAVPGGPGRAPVRALITLTTAASVLPSTERLIVIGELTDS